MAFAHPHTPLWVAPLLQVSSFAEIPAKLDIEDTHFAFAERGKNGDLQMFHGLKNFLYIPKSSDTPALYLFDNHNHALFFRYREYLTTHTLCSLLHIDQHSDIKENSHQLPVDLLQTERSLEVFRFVQRSTHVGNFIQPALQAGLISEMIPILSEYALKHIEMPIKPYILDIDLDFWAPEMGNQLSFSLPLVQQLIKKAVCVTIATSPYFLKQERAIALVKDMLSE
jgi:hypothetical protein